jgi:hypothetical protein
MSYEGYVVWLCENGHRHTYDCYNPPDNCVCSCGASRVWSESVDQTNDEGHPTRLRVKQKAVMCDCPKCGITHEVEPTRFYIPKR